jgi:hypothetical protein
MNETGETAASGAEEQAWRAIRAVLAGKPAPMFAPADAQAVADVLARLAAVHIAARFLDLGRPVLDGLALGYVDSQLAPLVYPDFAWADPP